MILPKLILTDIDGVWTDGGMYYDNSGNELKKFNTKDSAGVLFCKLLNIPLGVITGEKVQCVIDRMSKLEIDLLFMGVKNKLAIALDLCSSLGITLEEVAYVGDDINDILLLEKVGLSACPANAPLYVKKFADIHLKTAGGDGAFREFVELILTENKLMDAALDRYLLSLDSFKQ